MTSLLNNTKHVKLEDLSTEEIIPVLNYYNSLPKSFLKYNSFSSFVERCVFVGKDDFKREINFQVYIAYNHKYNDNAYKKHCIKDGDGNFIEIDEADNLYNSIIPCNYPFFNLDEPEEKIIKNIFAKQIN